MALSEKEIIKIFRETQVLQDGHFLLTSGLHSDQYMQCAKVLQYPHFTATLCKELAGRFQGEEIDLVVAPAVGGILIGYEVARSLGTRAIFAEREEGKMVFRRGFEVSPGENVLVVEDVITTGGSVREVIEAARQQGAQVKGVGVFIDRSKAKARFDAKTEALLTVEINTYSPGECPLCQKGLPLIKPGSRKNQSLGAR